MSAEYSDRKRHLRQSRPTSHWSRDVTDTQPPPGIPSACELCHPDETEEGE